MEGKKRKRVKKVKIIKKKKKTLSKMARHGNNIVMVKRQTTKKVSVLSGRVFTARFKRVKHSDLPANIRIRRTYRGNPV